MLRAVIPALVGTLSIAAVYSALRPDVPPDSRDPAAASPAVAEQRPQAAARAPEREASRPAGAVRNVTPDELTAGPVAAADPVRIAARPQPEKPPPQPQRLFRPEVREAGLIVAKGREIRLAGVSAPRLDATCGETAAAWPCGRMARAALRRFIRGRALDCEVATGTPAAEPTRCSVGGQDLGQWLVAHGWAKRQGEAHGELEERARAQRLGVWSPRRPGPQPDGPTADSASSPASAMATSRRVSGIP